MLQSLALQVPQKRGPRRLMPQAPRLQVLWLLLSACLLAFVAEYAVSTRAPALAFVLTIASSVNCGLSWLLARELFTDRYKQKSRWPDGVVLFLFAACMLLFFADIVGIPRVGLYGFIGKVAALVSSTVLVMPFFEAMDGYNRSSAAERRFRVLFMSGYGGILGFALFLEAPSFASFEHTGQVMCCLVGLVGIAAAVQYRKRTLAAGPQVRNANEETAHLADRLTRLLDQERVYLKPDIKVSDLARSLGQPDYKITRSITQQLGFQNFNQLINFYRIEEAKRLLADRSKAEESILNIAMDSGFGSIGPFNRAFKKHTGLTPRAFRTEQTELA